MKLHALYVLNNSIFKSDIIDAERLLPSNNTFKTVEKANMFLFV